MRYTYLQAFVSNALYGQKHELIRTLLLTGSEREFPAESKHIIKLHLLLDARITTLLRHHQFNMSVNVTQARNITC